MIDDRDEPQKPKVQAERFEEMSIEALSLHVESLKAEIVRAEEMIRSKRAARDFARGIFKT